MKYANPREDKHPGVILSSYLSHWYGLREFLILSAKRNNDAIVDEDRANILLSSTAIAVSNVGW